MNVDDAVSSQWMKQTTAATDEELTDDNSEECAAYDVSEKRIIAQPCHRPLAMICQRRSVKSSPLSKLVMDQFFCPPGWVSHPLVLDAGVCYRRFSTKSSVDWDEASGECLGYGGHLATASTQSLRVALEHVHAHFIDHSVNQSVVQSWIGLRQTSVTIQFFLNLFLPEFSTLKIKISTFFFT